MTKDLADGADDAATALEEDERKQLIPTYITSRAELNEAEQVNISDADGWAFSRQRDVLDTGFLLRLHKRMLGDVWRWAGSYRTTERNIGIEAWRIPAELAQLLDDVRFWVAAETYGPDEVCIRFHHRLVAIHPFPNGNGRLARMAADLLAVRLGRPRFSWGRRELVAPASARAIYIAALQAADRHDIAPLLQFARPDGA
ncbi:mobile mystery protein B [Maricaulis salignorans]|uniref:Mobile mystery protein B n=1 Tax=Maricaulis salignorans TaxID=144026 RepID=A0A1G9LL89_9PROT|nr:mobile mystery protein B [Maricaulis salignorans]SDL62507.1 mobile mystery protein B [Maricaulis salignorans]